MLGNEFSEGEAMIEIGKRYKDSISGFVGTAIGRKNIYKEVIRVQLQSDSGEVLTFAEERLVEVTGE